MKLNLTIFFACLLLVMGNFSLFSFDWPQEGVTAESFSLTFGQFRGGNYSNALIFSEPAQVSATETGTVVAILGENGNEMGWFHSPLGNAVILAHEDSLLSVYGNLTEVDITSSTQRISKGTNLGTSGSSGWRSGQSSLEFQIIDTEREASINPQMLMPRFEEKLPISLYGITAIGRNGETLELRTRRSISTGTYKLYRGRDQGFFPHTTSVSVNGAEIETITFDALTRSGRRLTVVGHKAYNSTDSYPTTDKQFLAEINLSRGKNTLSVTVADINGKEYTVNYTLEVW